MKDNDYKNLVKQNEQDFKRNRKIGFLLLLVLILRMIRKSTQLELDEFRERFMPTKAAGTSYTKQAFSAARQKLSPTAFTLLNDELIQSFYEDGDYKTYKGFRLSAIDGCVCELPNTRETQEAYGYVTTSKAGFRAARARTSHLYDLENELAISTCMGRYDANERDMAKQNIEEMLRLSTHPVRDLLLFDRGYPSADMILYLQEKELNYVMRVSGRFYTEVVQTKTVDEVVTVTMTKARARQLQSLGKEIPEGTQFQVRVLKIELSTGETEILITNVNRNEISYEEFKPLYFKRWGIETRFDLLKQTYEIENFSGQKPFLIEQDFYATVLLSNMASLCKQDAEEELRTSGRTQHLKYSEYRINQNLFVGKLRNRLIKIVLEEDDGKKEAMYAKFLEEIQRNIVPVIPGRSFKRERTTNEQKFPNTKRRGL